MAEPEVMQLYGRLRGRLIRNHVRVPKRSAFWSVDGSWCRYDGHFDLIPAGTMNLSSPVPRSPSPARSSPGIGSRKSSPESTETILKDSYNVSTFSRINLLTSASRQTLSLASKSKTSLETLLETSQATREIQSKVDVLTQRVTFNSKRLEDLRCQLHHSKRRAADNEQSIVHQKEEINQKYQSLEDTIAQLNDKRSKVDVERSRLRFLHSILDKRRAEVCSFWCLTSSYDLWNSCYENWRPIFIKFTFLRLKYRHRHHHSPHM